MKHSGIDLHSNNSVVVVTDDADRVLTERRVPNDLAKILGLLEPWREEIAWVVVESTFNWYWLVDGLQAAGFKVHLARKRMQLVRSRTTHILPVENITARQHGARISSNQVKRLPSTKWYCLTMWPLRSKPM